LRGAKQRSKLFACNTETFLKMKQNSAVYIITNKNNKVLYTGVTTELKQRITDHKNKKYKNSFTCRYNINKLVFFEAFSSIEDAIAREKQIKAGSREKKLKLINSINPGWKDLYSALL